jgi:hypothetical protein
MQSWHFFSALLLAILMPRFSQAVEPRAIDIRPMALAGELHHVIDNALIELSRGDTTRLEALPITVVLSPIARSDPNDSSLSYRWTSALPKALARLPHDLRAQTLARLDARYLTLLTPNLTPHERARLAVAFLPAPTALAAVQYEANIAFDLGHLTDYLGISQLLSDPDDHRRQSVALQLSGLGPEVDPSLQLVPPGTAIPTATLAATAISPPSHLAIRWVTQPGWVLAVDPFEQVVWQYRVDRNATVVTGPGAALVRDSQGVRVLNDAGSIQTLTPLPSGAQILSVAGGSAWFSTNTRGWRMTFIDGHVTALELGAVPFGAPVVRGQKSLWLTARFFVLFDGDRVLHRFQHQLPVASDWFLASTATQVQLRAPDGRQWQLSDFSDQLLHEDMLQQAQLFIRAHRFQEALRILNHAIGESAKSTRLRAQIGLALEQNTPLPELAPELAKEYSPADQALILSAHFARSDHDNKQDLTNSLSGTMLQAGDALCRAYPTLTFTTDLDLLLDETPFWNHTFSAAAWTQWRELPKQPSAFLTAVEPSPIAQRAATTLTATRHEDGSLHWGNRQFTLSRTTDTIIVSCHHMNGKLLWRNQWRPISFAKAPSQYMEIRDGVVYISEGTTRMVILHTDMGVQLGTFFLNDGNGTYYFLSPTQLAQLGPLGLNTHLTLIDQNGRGSPMLLSSPAQWACVLGDQIILRLSDKSAIAYPIGKTVAWPSALLQQPQAPLITAHGLQMPDQLWPWTRH